MKAILYDVPRGTMDETSSLWTLVSIALPRSVRESERLFLLIPCWESQRLIPKRSAGPRATKIGVVSLKALDHHRPNREESAVLPFRAHEKPGREDRGAPPKTRGRAPRRNGHILLLRLTLRKGDT